MRLRQSDDLNQQPLRHLAGIK